MDPLEAALAEVDALCVAGRIRAALERAEAALAGTDVREGRALDGLRRVRVFVPLVMADRPRAHAATLRDLEDARGVDGATLARALVLRGNVVNRQGDAAAGRALVEEALVVARRCGDPGAEADALCELAELAIESGDATGARAALAAAEDLAVAGSRERLLDARGHVGLRAGNLDAAAAAYRELAETARWPLDRAHACYELVAIARSTGRLADALALADRGLASLATLDAPVHLSHAFWNMKGEIQRAQGDLAGALESYQRSAAGFGPGTIGWYVAGLNQALIAISFGRYDVARERAGPRRTGATHAHIALARELVDAVLAAHDGDGDGFDDRFRPFLLGGHPLGYVDDDFALLAARASDLAERRRSAEWLVRAVRARRLALDQARALGREAEVRAHERALRRLRDRGAPVPLQLFLLHRWVGRGAYGEVWQARHPSGAEVAVKVVHGAPAADLAEEIRAIAGLDHPNVARLLHAGRMEATAAAMAGLPADARWHATELSDASLAERPGLPWREVHGVLLDLLDALAHAHARGVLHLDVKPANVLVSMHDGRLVARLADFGLAVSQDRSVPKLRAGTVHYMAPELFDGDGVDVGPWTDLYAVGCTAVELVGGEPPFTGATADEVRLAHLQRPLRLAPVEGAPEGLLAWLERLLAKDPAIRFRTAADAARALEPLGPARVPPRLLVSPELLEAGLGLFPLRRPPIVGREPELARLLPSLATPGLVAVHGAPGVGSTALVRALAERASERGLATVFELHPGPRGPEFALLRAARALVRTPEIRRRQVAATFRADGADPALALSALDGDPEAFVDLLGQLARRRPVLLVAHGTPAPALWRARDHARVVAVTRDAPPGATVLELLPPSDPVAVLRSRLPIEPRLAARLVERTGGLPRPGIQLLADLVARDALVASPAGYVLRNEGLRLPETPEELWRERVRTVGRPPSDEALLDAGLAERHDDRVRWVDPLVARAVEEARAVEAGRR